MEESFESSPVRWQDYWAMAVRRRWWLMGPLFLGGFVAFGVARFWPVEYRSEALILVEVQKVPELYVTPNVVTDLQDRLQSMTQQILSRTRVKKLIEQFSLYPNLRQHMNSDEIVDQMRKDIRIELVQAPRRQDELTAFRIYFSYGSAQIAQQITNALTSLFIDENLQARGEQSLSTTTFLENQLEQARKDLEQQEQQLREYKLHFLGELPQQEQSMLQMLAGLEAQLHSNTDAIDRAEQQRIYLESMRTEYQALQDSAGGTDPNAPASRVATADAQIRDLRKQLTDLEAKYTSRHPDVDRLRDQIADWEHSRKQLELDRESSPSAETSTTATPSPKAPALADVESRLKATQAEIEDYQARAKRLHDQMTDIESRLKMTPVREQQLAEVTRNYENSKQNYESLLQKKLQSELATNLEKRQQGEQFRIIDPPSLPLKPSEPNRLAILSIGWLVGLSLGLGLTALKEMTDETVHNERSLLESISVPVLVHIPVLRSRRERIRLRLSRLGEVMATVLILVVSVGMGIYTYLVG
jgi:polysaccharide chain length determinant protein (PEP-CTERM system associated)